MLSLRQMSMEMDGIRSASQAVAPDSVFASNYTVTPTSMSMDMTMLGAMYAPSDDYTLMAMISHREIEMDHLIFGMAAPLIALNDGSREFTTSSSGLGDLKFSAIMPLSSSEGESWRWILGLSLPTGSIDEQDLIPGPGGRQQRLMPAPMQLGSGTLDLLAGLGVSEKLEHWSWGAQADGVLRAYENDRDYRLGDELSASGWIAKPLGDSLSASLRLNYKLSGKMKGTQEGIGQNPPFAPSRRTVTTAFSENYGGEQLDLLLGANLVFQHGPLAGHRLALEISLPLLRDLNGYQLETDRVLAFGWQKSW